LSSENQQGIPKPGQNTKIGLDALGLELAAELVDKRNRTL